MSNTGKLIKPIYIIILVLASSFFIAACSAPAEKMNQEGNQAFAEQAYLEALDLYQSAQIESPELAEPYFNAANTFYRQGDYPAALEQMQMALQYVDEALLAESSLFNMGNTLYNSQDLNQAVEAYTQALLLDPEDQDAKYNLELALQQQEQEQQQQQQEKNQEEGEDSQNEEQSQSEEQSGEGDESQDEQEGEQGDQSQDSETQDQGNQDEEGEQSQENDPQNDEQQSEGNGQPQQDEESQNGDHPSQIPPPGQRMTEEQARQLLAALANDMETLPEHLGQILLARQAPPIQDW